MESEDPVNFREVGGITVYGTEAKDGSLLFSLGLDAPDNLFAQSRLLCFDFPCLAYDVSFGALEARPQDLTYVLWFHTGFFGHSSGQFLRCLENASHSHPRKENLLFFNTREKRVSTIARMSVVHHFHKAQRAGSA